MSSKPQVLRKCDMAARMFISFIVIHFMNSYDCASADKDVFNIKDFVFWPNGVIPFYIDSRHFDSEQSLAIMSSLARFAFKTCLEFKPVFVEPTTGNHVMVFQNPDGIRKCVIDRRGHSRAEPHRLTIGFECLSSPQIDMMIMKALGFPFEHNRASRDLYIDVLMENIEPNSLQLFEKEHILPVELRTLPYDVHSVLHFSDRDYSKNGHRTFIFKNPETKQHRLSLTATDLQKIEIIYGPECNKRDRLAKIDICKNYAVNKRRKRQADVVQLETVTNLRINREIRPSDNDTEDSEQTLQNLGIEEEIQELLDRVHRISAKALNNAKKRLCNDTKDNILRTDDVVASNDIVTVVESVTNYVKNMVDDAMKNLTLFCNPEVKEAERSRCGYSRWCPRSTNIGPVQYSTQHRPVYKQPTKHVGGGKGLAEHTFYRSGNMTESPARRKRNVDIDEVTAKMESASRRKYVDDSDKSKENSIKSPEGKINEKGSSSKNKNKKIDKHHEERQKESVVKSKKVDDGELGKDDFDKPRKSNSAKIMKRYSGKKKTYSDIEIESEETEENINKNKRKPKWSTDSESEDAGSKKRIKKNGDLSSEENDNYRPKEKNREKPQRLAKNVYASKEETSDGIKYQHSGGDPDSEEKPRKVKKIKDVNRDTSDQKERSQKSKAGGAKLPKTVPLSKKNKDFYAERIWPDGAVPYLLEENSKYDLDDVRRRLDEVNEILKSHTCVQIQEIEKRDANKYEDYLVLDTSADFITGRVGGRQQFGVLELFEGGQHRQHAAMLVMGMLGFYFELSRHDRDNHVRVHNRHIRPDKLHHFEKLRSDATLPLPYDYKSATHPAWQFWRRIGKTGISTVATYKDKDPDGKIMKMLGQNTRLLSKLDIVKINSVYGTVCFENEDSAT